MDLNSSLLPFSSSTMYNDIVNVAVTRRGLDDSIMPSRINVARKEAGF